MTAKNAIAALAEAAAADLQDRPVLRQRQLGVWQQTSARELAAEAGALAAAFQALGLCSGDPVAIVATNQQAWVATDWAGALGGFPVLGVDPDAPARDVVAAVSAARAVLAVVGDEEQHDKLVEDRASLPSLRWIVVLDTRGLRRLDRDAGDPADAPDGVVSFARLLESASEGGPAAAAATAAVMSGPADQAAGAVLIATPDGVERVPDETVAEALRQAADAAGIRPGEPVMELRTLADPSARALAYSAMQAGAVVHLGRDPRLLLADLREARPVVVHSDAAVLQRVMGDAEGRAHAIGVAPLLKRVGLQTGVKRAAWAAGLRRARKVGPRRAERRTDLPVLLLVSCVLALALVIYSGQTRDGTPLVRVGVPALVVAVYAAGVALAGLATARPLRNRYGLGRARVIVAGALPPSDTLDWFWGFGVPVLRSETTGPGFLTGVTRPE